MNDTTQQLSPEKQGFIYCLRLLAISKKSCEEIRKRLLEKGYSPEISERILESLKQKNLLSDEKFAKETAERTTQTKRYGKHRLKHELKRRGISEHLIEQTLKTISDEDEESLARELGKERWSRLAKIDPTKRKHRIYQYLVGRGYGFELSQQITQELFNQKS